MSEEKLNRRDFLIDSAVLLVSVTAISPFISSCSQDQPIKGADTAHLTIRKGKLYLDLKMPAYNNLKQINNGVKIKVFERQKPIIVTRVSPTEVGAFSAECTHAGNEVLLPQNDGVLVCESGHGGSFDIHGNVISPPPKSNLKKYQATLTGETIIIDLKKAV